RSHGQSAPFRQRRLTCERGRTPWWSSGSLGSRWLAARRPAECRLAPIASPSFLVGRKAQSHCSPGSVSNPGESSRVLLTCREGEKGGKIGESHKRQHLRMR